jgi:hypothetical protein
MIAFHADDEVTAQGTMKIHIASIHNAGDLDQEYVSLEAKEKCKAFSYLLARTTSMKGLELSSRLLRTYWIPIPVRKADSIEIYTKAGTDSERTNADKTTTYLLHWGIDTAVWDAEERALLLEISDWRYSGRKKDARPASLEITQHFGTKRDGEEREKAKSKSDR